MPKEKSLIKQGFTQAAEITRCHAKTFYFASRLLPKNTRDACYVLYAFCRISDSSVDDHRQPSAEQNLAEVQKNLELAYSQKIPTSPLLLAFRKTIREYHLPKEYFLKLVSGMRQDLEKTRYANFPELYDYCYKVAGVVGLMMLKIFRCADPLAEKTAVELGIAMQLTNILRDIKEDFLRGRIYLPQEEMQNFMVSEKELAEKKISVCFEKLLKFQIQRALDYYKRSKKGIALLSHRRFRLVVLVMHNLYSGILQEIEKKQYDIFRQRAHLNSGEKMLRLLKIIFQGEYL